MVRNPNKVYARAKLDKPRVPRLLSQPKGSRLVRVAESVPVLVLAGVGEGDKSPSLSQDDSYSSVLSPRENSPGGLHWRKPPRPTRKIMPAVRPKLSPSPITLPKS